MMRDLPDVNVLVALALPRHDHHKAANAWFETAGDVATTPITESGLLRILMNPAVTGESVDASAALAILKRLRSSEGWGFLPDDSSLADTNVKLNALQGYRQITDAHLLALAYRHDMQLVTFDAKIATAFQDQASTRIRVLLPF